MNTTRLRETVATTARYLPGMYPNAPKRNLIVLISYVLLLSVVAGAVHLLAEVWLGVLAVHGATGLSTTDTSRRWRQP